jgi:hypothetical protein
MSDLLESESKKRLPHPLRVDDAALRVIQAPKPEPRIMRYELTDYEWAAIKPSLPNKPRGHLICNDQLGLALLAIGKRARESMGASAALDLDKLPIRSHAPPFKHSTQVAIACCQQDPLAANECVLGTSLYIIAHFRSRLATVRPSNPCIPTQRWFRNLPICEALSYADESAVRGKNRTSFDEETIGNFGRFCAARQRRCSIGAATDPEAVR